MWTSWASPKIASTAAGQNASRSIETGVLRPPSSRMNDRKRHAADQIGQGEIVIGDVERSIFAREHAKGEKGQQHRGPDAARDQAGEDAEHAQPAAEQDQPVGIG